MARFLRAFALVLACLIGATAPHGLAAAHVALPAANPIVVVPSMGGTTFTPATPGNLIAWWDLSDLTTLFSSNACTGATSNGGGIGCVTDKSGSGHNVTQATAGNRPTRTDSAQNSKTGATFVAGSTQHLDSAAFTIAQPCTVVVWFKSYSSSGYIIDGLSVNSRVMLMDSASNPAHSQMYGGTSFLLSTNTVDPATVHMIMGVFNGASSVMRLDGTETTGSPGTATETAGMTLAAAASPPSVVILEGAVYSVALSSTDRGKLQTYGQGKWAAP